jgi:chromosome partitioning protein
MSRGDEMEEKKGDSPNGIRVVMVMNRKGGCGKSTLVKGLASAAAERRESVTIFDTDSSESAYQWMLNAKELGNWAGDVTVIKSLDIDEIAETIDRLFDMPDQEHLVLIDTFGGASEAIDDLAMISHFIVIPSKLLRSDVTETTQTLKWHANLKRRAADPAAVPPSRVMLSAVPVRRNEAEETAYMHIMTTMPTLTEPVMQRAAYVRMDLEGMLGAIRDNLVNKANAKHMDVAIAEMESVLGAIDEIIKKGQADG